MDVLDFLSDSITGGSFFGDIFRHPSKNSSTVQPLQMYGSLCVVVGGTVCKCAHICGKRKVVGGMKKRYFLLDGHYTVPIL